MKHKENILLFSIGAIGYGLMEVMWRGYTHPSMLTAGGICFTYFAKIGEKLRNKSIIVKALIGSCFVTFIELIFGIVFNVILKKNVWDYSKLPLNLGGQICLIYSSLWVVISAFAVPLSCFIKRKLRCR